MKALRLALLQTKCVPNKEENIRAIASALQWSAQNKANICLLGQVCNSPYTPHYLHAFAQSFDKSVTLQTIKSLCLKHRMYAIGSIPRIEEGNYYNTAFVINPTGALQTSMDKLHLFDIDIPNKITYKESNTFKKGNQICVFDTEYCKIGLGICYDLRFAELGLLMAQKGAKLLIYPGSFNHTTGPLHFELLLRARAIDNLCYVAGVSTAQYKEDPSIYQAWGHSSLIDPFGKVLVAMDENVNYQVYDIDLNYVDQVREQIPIFKQKRNDMYVVKEVKE